MSLASSVSSPLQTERRSHARRRIEGLAYVDFGPDNGAILIDLGEGGLGFQSVAPVSLEQAVLLKFKLPGGVGYYRKLCRNRVAKRIEERRRSAFCRIECRGPPPDSRLDGRAFDSRR